MENKKEKQEEKEKQGLKDHTAVSLKKKVSRTWAAAIRLKGSLIVNDPKFLM